jgi:hypothetical protein
VASPTVYRWPWLGAAALAPVTAAAVRYPRLRPLAALLWHQTEEWVWPGGFIVWINREVLGSGEDEFPLDQRTGVLVNCGFGWGLSVLVLAGERAAAPAAALYASHLGNAALHLGWAARRRRYDPGSVTAAATLAPLAVIGLRELVRDPAGSRSAVATGAVAGALSGAALAPGLRWRMRRRGR